MNIRRPAVRARISFFSFFCKLWMLLFFVAVAFWRSWSQRRPGSEGNIAVDADGLTLRHACGKDLVTTDELHDWSWLSAFVFFISLSREYLLHLYLVSNQGATKGKGLRVSFGSYKLAAERESVYLVWGSGSCAACRSVRGVPRGKRDRHRDAQETPTIPHPF